MFDIVRNRNTARIWSQLPAAFLIALVFLALAQPVVTRSQESDNPLTPESVQSGLEEPPAKPDKLERVYDLPGRLNEDQYARFHFDIGRMWNDGLPALIYIRASPASAGQSQYFADQLREKWQIQSSPGADDGLVMLVTIRDRFPHTAILSLSYGANSFPQGQMTVDVLNQVLEEEVTPRIRVGNVNGGLTYAVRRILYYTEYTAPFPPPLTNLEESVHRIATPINAILTLMLVGLIAIPTCRLPRLWRGRPLLIALSVSVFALSSVLAVGGRNTTASALAIVDIALILALLLKFRRKPRQPVARLIRGNASSTRGKRQTGIARSSERV